MILWRFGDIYLDSDVILRQNITNLGNFVSEERFDIITNAQFGFVRNHTVLREIIRKQLREFNGKCWAIMVLRNSLM
jgi:mannosyltransferase OCH1-like enzyme